MFYQALEFQVVVKKSLYTYIKNDSSERILKKCICHCCIIILFWSVITAFFKYATFKLVLGYLKIWQYVKRKPWRTYNLKKPSQLKHLLVNFKIPKGLR